MKVLIRRARLKAVSVRHRVAALGRDAGALSLFLVILFPGLLAFAGLVVDIGTKLDDYQNAASYAQEAARAGAGQVDQSQAYSSSTFVIDQAEAVDAIHVYLDSLPAGVTGSVTSVGATTIQVKVTVTSPTKILSIIGIPTVSGTSTATATLLTGVTGPGA